MQHNQYYKVLRDQLKKGEVQRRTVLSEQGLGDEALFVKERCVGELSTEPHDWMNEQHLLIEDLSSEVELVIFGGGHIALELYHIALRLELEVTIIDEREEYCNVQRFPKARCICTDFEEVFKQDRDWVRPYFIIATRGHSYDQLCLEQVLKLPHWYIGMIGSKNKVAKTFENLKIKGYTDAQLALVHAPIGLDIHAVSASEIALSILAEVVSQYRKRNTSVYMEKRVLQSMMQEEPFVVVRVIDKTGSAPCRIGFQLACFPDHSFIGTIGGGVIEALALEHARAMIEDPSMRNHIQSFSLDSEKAGSVGMICGGSVTLLFQRR